MTQVATTAKATTSAKTKTAQTDRSEDKTVYKIVKANVTTKVIIH